MKEGGINSQIVLDIGLKETLDLKVLVHEINQNLIAVKGNNYQHKDGTFWEKTSTFEPKKNYNVNS